MDSFKQPNPMSMEGDIGKGWKKFKASFDLFSVASGLEMKTPKIQAAALLHCIGEDVRETIETIEMTEEKDNITTLKKKLEDYFVPKSNPSVESHKFNTRTQGVGEDFDTYLSDLRRLAANCDFGALKEQLIKDRIVCGIRNSKVRDRLLQERDLNLTKAIEICRAAEQADLQIKQLSGGITKLEVHAVKQQSSGAKKAAWQSKSSKNQGNKESEKKGGQQNSGQREEKITSQRKDCHRCGYKHSYKCPAWGKTCLKSKKSNHFASVCKNGSLHAIENETKSGNSYVMDTIEVNALDTCWYETTEILDCNKRVKFKLDTGAEVNVIPEHIFQILKLDGKLRKTDMLISNYCGRKLDVSGNCDLKVRVKGKDATVNFVIVKTLDKSPPILGIRSLQDLGLVQRNSIGEIRTVESLIEREKDLFQGTGKIKMKP